ncbi:MAG: hypothetical protein E7660_00745 [Ruminococcaceae bacterium]|nr:hypothetical protein [Oscillospiraceae bacterium]
MIRIIPTPRQIEEKDGSFDLSGVSLFVPDFADKRILSAAAVLIEKIEAVTGGKVYFAVEEPFKNSVKITCGEKEKAIFETESEGYTLTVSKDGVKIHGDGAAGAFYGIQTLRQLVKLYGKDIPFCEITDAPDFGYRGFYLDITRGRVPKLEKLKRVVDLLSFYKVNSLQLYVEDAFTFRELEGIADENNAMTPDEIRELDLYCREHFIELIPSLSTFGHLYTLLQSDRYRHICELENYEPSRNYWMEKQWHHTVDPYDPETIKVIGSMIDQYAPLFSSEYFNICCDETIDLCKGKNEGKDKAEAYFYHVEKLIEVVKKHGKKVMMWGDEPMAYPEKAKEKLPSDTVILNWCYRREVAEWIPQMFSELGFPQIACTGTSCWDAFIENVNISAGNITSFSRHAKKYNALGILNTNWGDFGHVCAFNCNLYGMLFGAEKSWNVDSEIGEEFEKTASHLLYGVTEFNMVETLRRLGRAAFSGNWFEYVMWHSAVCLEGKNKPHSYGEWGSEEKTLEAVKTCEEEISRLSALGREDAVTEDLILAARALLLMNRLRLYVNGAEGFEDKNSLQKDFDLWLEDYSAAWLREDKPSDLPRIREFVKSITDVPVITED